MEGISGRHKRVSSVKTVARHEETVAFIAALLAVIITVTLKLHIKRILDHKL